MDSYTANLNSAALDGSDVRKLFRADTKSTMYSIDVYEDHIYLCYNRLIVRIHKHLQDEFAVVYNATETSDMLYALRVYQEEGKITNK